MTPAIVLKNYGAREVYFDYDRTELRADPRNRNPEDVGITPIWIVSEAARRHAVVRAIHA